MKYTRRSILKRAGAAGLLLFMPGIVKSALILTGSDDNEDRRIFDEWEACLKKMDLMPDVIIINNFSVKEFDMVSLAYNRERSDAPVVLFSKNEDWQPRNIIEIKTFIKELERFACRNNVYLNYLNKEEEREYNKKNLIKAIRECGLYNEISEELYRPVSLVYVRREFYNRGWDYDKLVSRGF